MNLDWKSILTRHPVFSALEKKEVDYLIEVSDEKEYEKDDVVIREGERANSLFVIGFGAVEVVLPWRGEQTIHLTTLTKGEFFGEVALFEKPSRRSATVIAAEPCVLLEIDGEKFLTIARKHPEIVIDVIEKVTSRLRDIGDHVLKVKLRDMDEKIQTLNTRLDAELRATDATLNATQTVFDQTSRRANEVIESAERSRNRLTTTASIIATGISVIVAVFGYVGFSQLQDVFEVTDKITEEAAEISKIKAGIELEIIILNNKLEELDAMAPKVAKVNARLKVLDEQLVRYNKELVLPQFSKALRDDTENAKKMYWALLQLQDDGVTNEMFEIINATLFQNALETETDDKDNADTDKEDNAIINMLEADIPGYEKTPRQEMLSYFAILLWYTMNDEREQFKDTLIRFQEYAKHHRDSRIRNSLPVKFRENYEDYISGSSADDDEEDARRKTRELALVWKQIP